MALPCEKGPSREQASGKRDRALASHAKGTPESQDTGAKFQEEDAKAAEERRLEGGFTGDGTHADVRTPYRKLQFTTAFNTHIT